MTLKATKPTKPVESSFIRTPTWSVFKEGDQVKLISGFLSDKRGYTWTFKNHVFNPETNSEWIELYGGSRTDVFSIRSFKPENIALIEK